MKNLLKIKRKAGNSVLAFLMVVAVFVSFSFPNMMIFAQSNDGVVDDVMIGTADGPTAIFIVSETTKTPQERVLKGLFSLFKFEENPLRDFYLGETEIFEQLKEEGGTLSGQIKNPYMPMSEEYLDIKIPQKMYFDWQLSSDGKKPYNAALNLDLGIGKESLLAFKSFANLDKVQFSIPQLSKHIFGVDLSGDIVESYSSSPLAKESETESLAHVANYLELMKENVVAKKSSKLADILTKITKYKGLRKAFKMYQDTWQIEPLEMKAFTINGLEKFYGGFRVTISKQATEDFFAEVYFATQEDLALKNDLDAYYDEMTTYAVLRGETPITKEEFYLNLRDELILTTDVFWRSDDLDQTFNIYLDEQNRAVSFYMPYMMYGDEVSLSIEKYGGVTLAENMRAVFTLTDDGETAKMVFDRQGNTNILNSNMNLTIKGLVDENELFFVEAKANENFKDNTWFFNARAGVEAIDYVKFNSKGSYSDIVRGQAYTVNLEKADLTVRDEIYFSIAGNLKVSTEVGEIKPISQQYTNIFNLNEQEIEAIEADVEANSEKLMERFKEVFLPEN